MHVYSQLSIFLPIQYLTVSMFNSYSNPESEAALASVSAWEGRIYFLVCDFGWLVGFSVGLEYNSGYCFWSGTHPYTWSRNISSRFCSATKGMAKLFCIRFWLKLWQDWFSSAEHQSFEFTYSWLNYQI